MRYSSTATDVVVIYSDKDASRYERTEGIFEVRVKEEKKVFDSLIAAYKYYHLLNETAAIWDLTEGSVLVESRTIIKA